MEAGDSQRQGVWPVKAMSEARVDPRGPRDVSVAMLKELRPC